MPKQNVEKVRGPVTRDEKRGERPERPMPRYPSDQGEYATEDPKDRADPTTSRRRAAGLRPRPKM